MIETSVAQMDTNEMEIEPDRNQPKPETEDQADSPKCFHMFSSLPDELGVMILQDRLVGELTPPIRTIVAIDGEPNVLTKGVRRNDQGLWHTGNNFVRGEVERSSIMLPTLQLTHPGNCIYYLDEGVCSHSRALHRFIGDRPVPKALVFYMNYDTALNLFGGFHYPHESSMAGWASLTNLLLDYQTFRALGQGFRSTNRHVGTVPPLLYLSGLKVLYLGFARRWTEIVLVEGPSVDDLLIRVQPVSKIVDGDSETEIVVWKLDIPEGKCLHQGLQAMILTALLESAEEVKALQSAGIEICWVAVNDEGITRRRDVISGYDVLDG